MATLVIAPADVSFISPPKPPKRARADTDTAGEAFSAGEILRKFDLNGQWFKAQCDGPYFEDPEEGDNTPGDNMAGKIALGMALGTADAPGARVSVALPGCIVAVGAGVADGEVYYVGATAGTLVTRASLVAGNRVTIAAFGVGNGRLEIARLYFSGEHDATLVLA